MYTHTHTQLEAEIFKGKTHNLINFHCSPEPFNALAALLKFLTQVHACQLYIYLSKRKINKKYLKNIYIFFSFVVLKTDCWSTFSSSAWNDCKLPHEIRSDKSSKSSTVLESHEGVKSDEEDECDTDPSDTLEPPGTSVKLILPVRLSRLPSIQSFLSKHSYFRSRKPTISCDQWQIHSYNPFKNMNPVSETGNDHISPQHQMKKILNYNTNSTF